MQTIEPPLVQQDANHAESTVGKEDTMKNLEQKLRHTVLQPEPVIPENNLDSETNGFSQKLDPMLDSQSSTPISDTTPAAVGQEIPAGETTQGLTEVLEPRSVQQTIDTRIDQIEANDIPDEGLAKEVREEQVHTEEGTSPMEPQPLALVQEVDEYLLKEIDWIDPNTGAEKRVKIITQNKNGPCPLVAISNVLLLRGDIEVTPFGRPSVTFEYIASQLGNYLLSRAPSAPKSPTEEVDEIGNLQQTSEALPDGPQRRRSADYFMDYRYNLNSALSMIPNLQSGLDINVYFNSINGFEPTAELALFDLFDVDLVHGWVVDSEDKETQKIVVNRCGSYNAAVECVISSDIASRHDNSSLSEQDRTELIHAGLVVSQFLESNATQLTYHGLQLLMDSIPRGKLSVLFRNNHFYTLYKHPDLELLYTLVTDSGFAYERALVWESLQDVDQALAAFYDSWFCPSHENSHGLQDGVGSSSEDQPQASITQQQKDLDYALALSLKEHHPPTSDDQPVRAPRKRAKRPASCIVS
ncbi:hypothetical protein K450DRAFT_243482 [Umbelopsis ramanniana AG]|uniref:MINDY deubiquitinase domain-containing protein n=1 Tax=Umbelopsis ramanniana AG TaxID=1314678 RepID=A0AAD5EAC1_UMBRA|nr:uncharacterized protein K450DRAFT_243482 [Umbelopsis ramanniana AG]KAI8579245.1 hypothetical protein K450DRAFT_243482 [Umbelopsis ramanniana AG]